tara:strand:- start:18 stop:407 length:390 start_codon:yes stop_codon:yes gene_type:complete
LAGDYNDVGRAGEFLAAAYMEQNGWRTVMATTEGVDLIAMKDGRIKRVQVKATKSPQKSGRWYQFTVSRGKIRRKLTKEDCDIVCAVAVDIGICLFKQVREITTLTVTVAVDEMTPEKQKKSFKKAFGK